ncbi:MAG: phasin family protein, partial [Paracoccaceae bacterium]|nr:phasin family protein [Paracoccaceae bacterium]
MAKVQNDYTKMMKDMMGSFPVDMSAVQDAFKTQATFGEKMSKVALEAADKSAEISSKWTKDTISRVSDVSKVKEDPADYSKAFTDFATAQAELVTEQLAAYAEIAKKVQMDTMELMLAAGKDISDRS